MSSGSMSWQHRQLRTQVLQRDGYVCRCPGCGQCSGTCPRRADQADHIVPRAAGGPDTLENYRAMCASCNASLGATYGNRQRSRHRFFIKGGRGLPARFNLSPPRVVGSNDPQTEQVFGAR